MTTTSMESSKPSSGPLGSAQSARSALGERVAMDIETYVRTRFSVPLDDVAFTRTVDLFEEGYVDSTGLVELIAYVEQQYGVRLPEEALFDPSFSQIEGIARVVADLVAP